MQPPAGPLASGPPGQQPMAAAAAQNGTPQLGNAFPGQMAQDTAAITMPFKQQVQQQQRFSMDALLQVQA
jgi:hypothetical protein